MLHYIKDFGTDLYYQTLDEDVQGTQDKGHLLYG
jgi:hypothetical protein